MGKAVKSVKKFVKKGHLGATIARRRKLKPMNNALRKKKAGQLIAGYAEDQAVAKAEQGNSENGGARKSKRVQDMSVDELMQGDFLENSSDNEEGEEDEAASDDDGLSDGEDEDDEELDKAIADLQADMDEDNDEDEDENENEGGAGLGRQNKGLKSEVSKHKQELEHLQQKDPEFYKFLQEHDKELLEFDDEDSEDSEREEEEDEEGMDHESGEEKKTVEDGTSISLSTALVETWCAAVKEKQHFGALKNLLRAFRTACHYGDGESEDMGSKFNISSSHVFNKIMLYVLVEIDGVFKKMLGLTDMSEKKGGAVEVQKLSKWKKLEPFVKTYLGNALHILNQMTDNQMIAFTVRRLKASVIFLAAFPILARKYMKVALHFWGSGEGALPLLSFMFIREMALRLGSDYLETCLKGMYKEYVAHARFVNPTSLPRIHFMASCVVELYGIDSAAAYQNAFIFIRQLAIVLRNALSMKTKEAFKQVYRWQYINSLNVWVRVLSTYKEQLRPLVYPLSQIIDGAARLVPTARYFPLRLQCVRMLNRLSAATDAFVPIASLLLDMLQFKDLHMSPTGGIGTGLDFSTMIKVPKQAVKTRAFQDDCMTGVIEQLTEHLAQNSYSVAFPELSVVPLVQIRRMLKEVKVDRFRKLIKQLVEQIERNVEYVGKKRDGVSFSPKDISAVASFLEEEKKAGASPLSKFAASLRQRAAQRQAALHTSSVLVGGDKERVVNSDDDEDDEMVVEEGAKAFSNDWLPSKQPPKEALGDQPNKKASKKKQVTTPDADGSDDEDVVEDLMLSSSDEDEEDEMDEDDDQSLSSGPDMDSDAEKQEQHGREDSKANGGAKKVGGNSRGGRGGRGESPRGNRGGFKSRGGPARGGRGGRGESPGGNRGGRGASPGGNRRGFKSRGGSARGGRGGSPGGDRGGFRGRGGSGGGRGRGGSRRE